MKVSALAYALKGQVETKEMLSQKGKARSKEDNGNREKKRKDRKSPLTFRAYVIAILFANRLQRCSRTNRKRNTYNYKELYIDQLLAPIEYVAKPEEIDLPSFPFFFSDFYPRIDNSDQEQEIKPENPSPVRVIGM